MLPRATLHSIQVAQALFNAGLFFDCHEYLEEAWKAAEGERKGLLQGLIQLGAALHKLELDPRARQGALDLLDRSWEKLSRHGHLLALEPERFAAIARIRARVAAGKPEPARGLRLQLLPDPSPYGGNIK